MPPERLRSIVPMFGGATSYVDTLDAILEYINDQNPTTDDFVGWHCGRFDRVSIRNSVMRRVEYLEAVGFLMANTERWTLSPKGEQYVADRSTGTLLEIMYRRNLGLRSLLYALSVGPMMLVEISRQQLETHPELGWDPANYDFDP